MLDLNVLKSAFTNISEIGKGEETFEITGTQITIRMLLPNEEVEVQKLSTLAYAEENKEDNEASGNLATAKYLETFKVAVLAYAIIQVNDLDLRNTSFVPTGDTLPNGKPVKVTKVKAMRDMLSSFSRKAMDNMFQRYSDLSTRIDIQTEKSLDYEPIDLTAEIERLEERLESLKAKQKVAMKTAGVSEETEEEVKEDETPFNQNLVTPEVEQEKVKVEPTTSTPNTVRHSQERQRVLPQQPQPVSEKLESPQMSKQEVFDTLESSFVDKGEKDPYPESVLIKEQERLAKMRSQRQHRQPPHIQAKRHQTDIGGIPVHRMGETQEIVSPPTPPQNAQKNLSIDSQPTSSKNPRFRKG